MSKPDTNQASDYELEKNILSIIEAHFKPSDGSLTPLNATKRVMQIALADRKKHIEAVQKSDEYWEKYNDNLIKKHELQAKKNGFYMAAGLFGADISRVEELWDKCEKELESYDR